MDGKQLVLFRQRRPGHIPLLHRTPLNTIKRRQTPSQWVTRGDQLDTFRKTVNCLEMSTSVQISAALPSHPASHASGNDLHCLAEPPNTKHLSAASPIPQVRYARRDK